MPSKKVRSIPKIKPFGNLSLIFGEMEEVRRLLLNQVRGISQDLLDYTPDVYKFETIGTLLFHIADVENSWIFEHFDGDELDYEKWKYAFGIKEKLEPPQLTGKPITFYRNILKRVRDRVRNRIDGFKDEDPEEIFTSPLGKTSIEWALFHIHQHESHHIGQINLIKRYYNSND